MEYAVIQKAFDWVVRASGEGFLQESEYCQTRDVFLGRLDHLRLAWERVPMKDAPLLIAVLGEIGNNAYDHNLGNWRDVPGAYFAIDQDKRLFVIADRGQGIKQTIARVKPDIQNDENALRAAFTETISGRSPEQRGNGLKFVKAAIEQNQWRLECYSGTAVIRFEGGETFLQAHQQAMQGTVTAIHL